VLMFNLPEETKGTNISLPSPEEGDRLMSSGMLRRVALVRTDVRRNLAPPSSG
jgi:hypothetical protein